MSDVDVNRTYALQGVRNVGRYPGFDDRDDALARAVEAIELGAPLVTLLAVDEAEDGKLVFTPLASVVPPPEYVAPEEASP